MHIGQGHLREAMRTFERGLQLGLEPGNPALAVRGTADMHVGLSEIYRERDELDTAMQHLLRSQELGQFKELAQNPYRWRAAMARIREAQGDLEGALDLLNEAERLYYGDFSPNVRPIAAMRARVWVAQGRLGDAFDWAQTQGLSAADDLSYLHEFEHITLARMLLAKSAHDGCDQSLLEAMGLLERLLQAAQAGGRMGRTIEILVLQALAQQMLGDIPAGLALLERALTLAEPEGYVRLFVDEGQPMARLLHEAAARGILTNYTSRLLAGFEAKQQENAGESPLPDLRGQTSPSPQPLIEPLSHRELDVLRLFKTDLMGPEIAAELVIALSTVRTHTKSIYSKLNVTNRRAAVKRAAEVGLI
jgi:LuxR family maltose regulon positive regulatory protein